jgi:hypothetical protein
MQIDPQITLFFIKISMTSQPQLQTGSWKESVLKALHQLPDQTGSLHAINEAVAVIRMEDGFALNATWHATVRRTLQDLRDQGLCESLGQGRWSAISTDDDQA